MKWVGMVVLGAWLSGCSVQLAQNVKFAIFDKLEAGDSQVTHMNVAGLGFGNVYLGRAQIDIFRVPGANDADARTVNYLNAAGQTIKTEETMKIGVLYEAAEE